MTDIDRIKHIAENMAGVLTCEDGTKWHSAELLPLLEELALLRTEVLEADATLGRLSSILSRAAIALRGPEPPLTRWDWSDIPKLIEENNADRLLTLKDAVFLRGVMEKLACLGNGDSYGNSVGNCIAQDALRDTERLQKYIVCEVPHVGVIFRDGRSSTGRPWHNIVTRDDTVYVPTGTRLYVAGAQYNVK